MILAERLGKNAIDDDHWLKDTDDLILAFSRLKRPSNCDHCLVLNHCRFSKCRHVCHFGPGGGLRRKRPTKPRKPNATKTTTTPTTNCPTNTTLTTNILTNTTSTTITPTNTTLTTITPTNTTLTTITPTNTTPTTKSNTIPPTPHPFVI
ncbi:hypothetical protein B566_EDAN012656 [Ephemera danica]|nr:hypothetical protein B566_EDAN012656 [Ephemera danica]